VRLQLVGASAAQQVPAPHDPVAVAGDAPADRQQARASAWARPPAFRNGRFVTVVPAEALGGARPGGRGGVPRAGMGRWRVMNTR
jgi:hypothetical protein